MKDTVDLVGDDDYLLSANGSLVGENDYLQSALCRLFRVNCY